jgi:hypothetical protein
VSSHHSEIGPITLSQAAVLLASGHGASGLQLRRAVDTQLLRRDVPAADRDDVRADVAFSLLLSTRADALSLDAACAHVALVARNKAVDLHRRARNEAPERAVGERPAEHDGVLERDLDAVSGEVHRRDVSRALVDLVRELPRSERLALTATATGAGHAGSGLGRSSHYRALDRARLRLSAVVRSRVAGGLALPAVLYRTADHLRGLLLPVGATAAAAIASAAFVLPTISAPAPRLAARTSMPRLTQATTSVARLTPVAAMAPAHVIHRRQTHVLAHVRKTAVHAVAPREITPRPALRQAPAAVTVAVAPSPAAGLDPCRAAQLCQ